MIIKTLLIASMAAFYLSIVPWGARTDQLVFYAVSLTKLVKDMYPFGSAEIRKFRAVIGLDHLWRVSEIGYCSLNKVYG